MPYFVRNNIDITLKKSNSREIYDSEIEKNKAPTFPFKLQ